MNKKTLGTIGIIVVVILLIIACFINPNSETKYSNDSSSIIENATRESSEVNENETKEFTEISVDEYINKYNGEERTLILVGRPTCHYCQIAEPILHNIAYKYDLNINYLNTDNFQDEDAKRFLESNEKFSNGFGTPMLLVISNGTINDMIDGLTDTRHYIEFLKENNFININY